MAFSNVGGVPTIDLGVARLPFSLGRPVARPRAVDAAGGRVVVTGHGIAAVEQGRVLWSAPSRALVRATAFEDDTLAVTEGPELRIVDRDGGIRQVFRTSDGEAFSTPPAVAHDGTIWAATDNALYRTR